MRRPCPGCPRELQAFTLRGSAFYACPDQDGLLTHIESVPGFVKDPNLVEALWARLRILSAGLESSNRPCPECDRGFEVFGAPIFQSFPLDVCRGCKLF